MSSDLFQTSSNVVDVFDDYELGKVADFFQGLADVVKPVWQTVMEWSGRAEIPNVFK